MPLKIPANIDVAIEAHRKWLDMVKDAQRVIEEDRDLQNKAATKGLRLKERALAPEVLGRIYVQYCNLINRMYEAYLGSVHLQRAPYMKCIVSVFMKRLYELRNELVHLILNDYIYLDSSLAQLNLTPADIEIIVPYHFAIEAREDSIEELLQTMWTDAVMRKNAPPPQTEEEQDEFGLGMSRIDSSMIVIPVPSVHSIVPEEFIQATIIQKQERFRRFYMADFRAKNLARRTYFVGTTKDVPETVKEAAASLIQKVYRRVMEIKRHRVRQHQLDVRLGLMADPWKPRLKYEDENRKLYAFRRRLNERTREKYLEELEKQKAKLILLKKDDQMEDISEQIKEWFNEWYLGYGFFPEYPYPVEGGTIMVIRGDFPTVEEKIEADAKLEEAMKGKTKEMLKAEKKQAKQDAKLKAEVAKENQRKEAIQEFKAKCNPFTDLGYKIKTSEHMESLAQALQEYSGSWSIYDNFPAKEFGDVIFGYMQSVIADEVMCQLHQECRGIVDEFMRLELKLLIAAHQKQYKDEGKKYPKIKPRKKPKAPPVPKPLKMDSIMNSLAEVFDLDIISKPTNKISDILGDSNYAASELNVRDPDAKFPPPGYGDIRQRLILSCVYGAGIEPNAARNKSVMLLGPPKNGKSFLVDCVAGELNAVKIDISPEKFSAVTDKPAKLLSQVFTAARVFQPSVIYLRDVERVFMTKVPPEDRELKAKTIKTALAKLVKGVAMSDRIIFIATCSKPFDFPAGPMVSLFDEMILVPRTDYGTVQSFFYYKLQSIRSMPRDYCVQGLAQLAQGFGFGSIVSTFEKVMSPERIVRLNVNPLMPTEFIEALMDESEPVTMEDYAEYVNFFIQNSPLRKERAEYEIINEYRAVAYIKMAKKQADDEKKAANKSKAD